MSTTFRITGGTLTGEVVEPEPPEPPTEPPPVEPPPVEPPPVEPPPTEPPPSGERRHPIIAAEELVIFRDGVLRDKDWICTQPSGTVHNVVDWKGGPGKGQLSIAEGAGINGDDCLELTVTEGLFGLWVLRYVATGGSYDNVNYGRQKFLAQSITPNRLSFWIRFPPGYREERSARQPPQYPNHQNIHFATYNAGPDDYGHESNNWHWYHRTWLRHHKAAGGWIYCEFNPWPSVQRSRSGPAPYNPTYDSNGLHYYECMTRFYVEGVSYYSDSEIGWPHKVYVDQIRMLEVDESAGPDIDWPTDDESGLCNYTDEKVEQRSYPNTGPFDAALDPGAARILKGIGRLMR